MDKTFVQHNKKSKMIKYCHHRFYNSHLPNIYLNKQIKENTIQDYNYNNNSNSNNFNRFLGLQVHKLDHNNYLALGKFNNTHLQIKYFNLIPLKSKMMKTEEVFKMVVYQRVTSQNITKRRKIELINYIP